MRVQGYIEIDDKTLTPEEFEEFNDFLNRYMVHYKQVSTGSREYFFCILRDVELLPDILAGLSDRNPIVNGVWDKEGSPYNVVLYPFDLVKHLSHTPPDITYDENGDIVTQVPVDYYKPLHGFSGWIPGDEY